MARIFVYYNASLFVICCFFLRITSANSYYSYEGGGLRLDDLRLEVLQERAKRYVSEPISRLADNFDKGIYPSKDISKTDGNHLKQAELIGSVAVMGTAEQAPLPQQPKTDSSTTTTTSSTPSSTTESTTEVPEKVTKKAVDKYPKKASELEKTPTVKEVNNSTKVDDLDDEGSFPKEISNKTLVSHNITQNQTDNHTYYTSEFISGEAIARQYWIDLENEKGVIVNEMLSKSHRRAATVRLSFDFPFYGHLVRNMTVATGGFLYTGDYIHSWLAATQYIAPLMANFDTSMSEDSFVKYRDNGTAFTVEWASVSLQDKKEAGKFSFQVTLHRNGDILFVYKAIPIHVDEIDDNLHPVKVGLSDAYIIDKTVFYIRKKTIYEYHRVAFNRDDIKNWTVIYIRAQPTCVKLRDCNSCVNHNTTFSCKWCDSIGRCSSGHDRFLQEWTQNNCPNTAVSEIQFCSKSTHQRDTSQPPSVEAQSKADDSHEKRLGHSGILGLFIVVCFLTCLGLWVFHAYRNPHTRFGQVLIKYRPSQWRMRRGEARYTAATIHM